ncbi:MAG TPA: substrate-binding domain-containing protein [Anaerolineaceae bacterium]|nr:substrate-binding domain-containing protein [Anaerolineaceae bacterium]
MSTNYKFRSRLTRRDFLKMAAVGTAGLALPNLFAGCAPSPAAQTAKLNVLVPAAPDPAPPGVAAFSEEAFAAWKTANKAEVAYEAPPWPQLHDKMAANFASGKYVHDIMYNCGWAPEFADYLLDFVDDLPADLVADLPASSFSTVTWGGKRLGVIFTLSLMTLFYNTEHLSAIGITEPPKTWDELKGYAKELTGGGRYGWVLNYGAPEGIGGVASYWMIFLQQAGGKVYDENGNPVFNNEAGVDALQFMMDLMESTDPGAISYVGINDATNVFSSGQASMMMNWPFMWTPANDPATSAIAGKVGSAILPAGAAGSASIDGTDAYTISKLSPNPDLARNLIEFYLDKEVQKRQVLDTGWLPIRMSVLNDPEVQEKAPNAAVILEQAKYPYDSFVTPDYNAITTAIGVEIQKALSGTQTAAETIQNAFDQTTEIIKKRS